MRLPKQVLVFLYRKVNNTYEYCLFQRENGNYYQAISGGVEEGETLEETVKREVLEETGIESSKIYKLSSVTSIPKINIIQEDIWEEIYVASEYSFAIEITNEKIKLSEEHIKYEWSTYEEAQKKLKYDSNKTALWELNERLLKSDLN
jgi:dATP pyrophosphohydrolase